jgi:hypothetical protein
MMVVMAMTVTVPMVIMAVAVMVVMVAAGGCGHLVRRQRDEARDEEADERQEDDCVNHGAQPRIMLTSSTAMEPRLR